MDYYCPPTFGKGSQTKLMEFSTEGGGGVKNRDARRCGIFWKNETQMATIFHDSAWRLHLRIGVVVQTRN